MIIIKSNEMKVNNSSLTGESEEMLRVVDEKNKNIFETPNVGFFGTSCVNGYGVGIVFKTGDETVIGQIANLADSAEAGKTPIQRELERFIKLFIIIGCSMGLAVFCINFAYNRPILTNFIFVIGIIVANVPEGLLITVTVSMALAAQRMAVKKCLVKNMQSVETMGSTSCICSDKTGTLTQNKMTVSHIYYCSKKLIDASMNYEDVTANSVKPNYDINDPDFNELMTCVALGSKAFFNYVPSANDILDFKNIKGEAARK